MKKLLLALVAMSPFFICSCEVKMNQVQGNTYCYKSSNDFYNSVTGTTKHIIKFNTFNKGESYWLDKDGDVVKHEGTFSYSVDHCIVEIHSNAIIPKSLLIKNGGFELLGKGRTYYKQ